jgi:GNAT superfamily N-acetyltransferase
MKNRTRRKLSKKHKKTRKWKGGAPFTLNIYDNTTMNTIPDNILEEASHICEPEYDNDSVSDILSDTGNIICIYTDKDNNEVVGFMILNENSCDQDCFDCKDKCMYIKLLCTKESRRGQGIFSSFLKEVKTMVKNKGVSCIRLTASKKTTFNVYKKVGFRTEKEDPSSIPEHDPCQYKMRLDL